MVVGQINRLEPFHGQVFVAPQPELAVEAVRDIVSASGRHSGSSHAANERVGVHDAAAEPLGFAIAIGAANQLFIMPYEGGDIAVGLPNISSFATGVSITYFVRDTDGI